MRINMSEQQTVTEQEQKVELAFDPALFPYDTRQLPPTLLDFERRHGRHEVPGKNSRLFVYADGSQAQFSDLSGLQLRESSQLSSQEKLFNARRWHEVYLRR